MSQLAPLRLPSPHLASGFGIRLNKKPPEITFRKKDKGGINYTSTVQNPKLDLDGAQRGRGGACWGLQGGYADELQVWSEEGFPAWLALQQSLLSMPVLWVDWLAHQRSAPSRFPCLPAAVKSVLSEYRIHNADVHLKQVCSLPMPTSRHFHRCFSIAWAGHERRHASQFALQCGM